MGDDLAGVGSGGQGATCWVPGGAWGGGKLDWEVADGGVDVVPLEFLAGDVVCEVAAVRWNRRDRRWRELLSLGLGFSWAGDVDVEAGRYL